MATFLVLWKFTGPAGTDAEPIKDAISGGAPSSHELAEQHGGKLVEVYLMMGQYDGAAIVEFPDEIACCQAMMAWRDFGVSTETLRAFPESEWSSLAAGI